jgi:hypothetical protein
MTSAPDSVSFLRFTDKKTGVIINHSQIHGMSSATKEQALRTPFLHMTSTYSDNGTRKLVFNLEEYLRRYFDFHDNGGARLYASIRFPGNSPLLEKAFSSFKIKSGLVDDLSSIGVRIDRDFDIVSVPLEDIAAPSFSVRKRLAKAGLLGFYPQEKILYYFIDLYIIIANEVMRRSNEKT